MSDRLKRILRSLGTQPSLRAADALVPLLLASALAVLLPASAAAARWKALSYNLVYGQSDFEAALDVIAVADADVLCLQELTPAFSKQFAKRFPTAYPHRHFDAREGTWGIGLASKERLEEVRFFEQAPHRMPALRAPTLLLGDFNESKRGGALTRLRSSGFSLACEVAAAACRGTWPASYPLIPAFAQVDHVLGRGLRFHSAAVLAEGSSDHYPIVAEFELERGRPRP